MPETTPEQATAGLWALWFAFWMVAAAWTSRTVERPGFGSQLPDRLITGVGAVILFAQLGRSDVARLSGLAGAALMTLGLYLKARLEERLLRGSLGAAYDEYREHVPMLIPRVGPRPR